MAGKKDLEKKGRKGDKVLAHLTPGEIVIPRAFTEDKDLRILLSVLFQANGLSLQQFIVGSGKNKINPETGYMEFGLLKSITRPFKKIGKEIGRAWKKSKDYLIPYGGAVLGYAVGGLSGAVIGAGLAYGLSGGLSGLEEDIKMPSLATPAQKTATAEPVVTLSEQAKRNRRLAASQLTKGFAEPKLSKPALLGISGLLGA